MKTFYIDIEISIGMIKLSCPIRITYDYHKNNKLVIIYDIFNDITNRDMNGWLASTSMAFDLELMDIYSQLEDAVRDHETSGMKVDKITVMPTMRSADHD